MRKSLVLLAIFAMVGACSSDDSGEVGSKATTSTTTEKGTTTTAVASPVASSCDDPGDAGGTGADLTKVTLARSGENLTVTYDVAGEVSAPPDGASWVIVASRGAGSDFKQHHLGLEIAGSEVTRFVFDSDANRQTELDTPYTATGQRVVASFPAKNLPPTPFAWRAVTTAAGNDVDFCPAQGTLTFSG
ncbi:MAG: hypothetical protein ABIS21_02095 [Acidimicrobiales bacterium]